MFGVAASCCGYLDIFFNEIRTLRPFADGLASAGGFSFSSK
jgi:hypothetical protein